MAAPSNPEETNRKKRSPWRYVIGVAKAVVAVVLIVLLYQQAQKSDAFEQLVSQPKNWPMLAASLGLAMTSVTLTFVRWSLIARAAGIALPVAEAIRVGALGFALNFVGPGAVGGDVFKGVVLARGRPGQRTAALTTIVVDRAMGLFSMLLFASAAILIAESRGVEMNTPTRIVCRWTLVATACLALGVGLLFVPGVVGGWLERLARKAPVVGEVLTQLIEAWSTYKRNGISLAGGFLLCVPTVSCFVLSFYCVALGLPLESPPLAPHFFIVPLELSAGAIPITPGGVGTREAFVEFLYQGLGVKSGQGALIAFGHSLTLLAVGGVATIYYFVRRASVDANIEAGESPGDKLANGSTGG